MIMWGNPPPRNLKEGKKKGRKGKKMKEKGEKRKKTKIVKSLSYLDISIFWGVWAKKIVPMWLVLAPTPTSIYHPPPPISRFCHPQSDF